MKKGKPFLLKKPNYNLLPVGTNLLTPGSPNIVMKKNYSLNENQI